MCGIFAVFSPAQRLPADAQVRVDRAIAAIKHRGPDAQGSHISPDGKFAFGHVRLAVIDIVAASNQPFWSEDGRYCLIFNGEIFNYLELRAELEREGVSFRTHSDTEVLMQAMIRWGPTSINRFNGMWGFVFGDVKTGKFIVSRDRWGVKPLHTLVHNGSLLICSEAKGIFAYLGEVPAPNLSSIGLYLKYGVGGEHPQSWFEGVDRFPQACYQEIDLSRAADAQPQPQSYWNYPERRTIKDMEAATRELDWLLQDAVKIRLRSDMPIGLSLSGGLDSGALAWLIGERIGQKLETYTAWYEPMERSELPRAQLICKTYGHRLTAVKEADQAATMADLRHCIYHLDSAHTSPAIVPYLNLCRAARKTLTVMIEGQGADELLAGYTSLGVFAGADRLLSGHLLKFMTCCKSYIRSDGWARLVQDYVRFMSRSIYERQAMRWNAAQLLPAAGADAVPDQMLGMSLSTHNLSDALLLSHSRGLNNLLQYGDAVSMSVSLETRCPFLDYRLVELGFQMDTNLLVDQGYGKYVLRNVANGKLPDEICWRRGKDGFTNPTTRVVRQVVAQEGLPKLGLDYAMQTGLFRDAIRQHGTLEQLPENILFRVVCTLLWAEKFYVKRLWAQA